MTDTLSRIIEQFRGRRIVVMGDLMLDRFIYGDVKRVSPEAPVPILLKQREEIMLGGAGNVARNIAALSGTALLVGVIGNDDAGRSIRAQIAAETGIQDYSATLSGARTTEKIRYVSQQQLLRVDIEDRNIYDGYEIRAIYEKALDGAAAVVLSDYAKGLLTPDLIRYAIVTARDKNIPVLVDPKAPDLSRYNGASLITPNRGETETATGLTLNDDEHAAAAAAKILRQLEHIAAVIVTRGESGMTLQERNGPPLHLKTEARKVFDVSGAGDTVVATLSLCMAERVALPVAAHIANVAAGIVVGKSGTATVSPSELDHALRTEQIWSAEQKIMTLSGARTKIESWRSQGKLVGFTNGCFDLIHPGHISLLTQAKANCDFLVVGLNSDASIKRLKGADRPIQDETARAIVLSSLASVDVVVPFGEDTPLALIDALRPDILVKGADYNIADIVGAKEVQSWGGKIILAEIILGQSTTKTIARMTQP